MKQLRKLKATLDSKAIRTEKFEGRDHLVVPIRALAGDAVIQAMGSEGPELVPAEELAKFPGGWNYRPGTVDHPLEGSANFPLTLERQAVGNIFNTKFENNLLQMEGWIDIEKATRLGGDATRLLERLRNAEVVEVSVGASIELQPVAGTTQDGKSFIGRWTDIVPDHLAFLPEGTIGAFSVEMGGGTRTARAASSSGILSVVRNLLSDKGLSNEELKRKLWNAVGQLPLSSFGVDADKVSAEFWGIDWVYPESMTCISAFYIDDEVHFFRHKYKQDGVKVLITGTPEEVTPTEPRFESLSDSESQPDSSTRKGETQVKKSEKVRKLIQLSSFTDAHEEWLNTQTEEQLDSFLASYEKPDEPEEAIAVSEEAESVAEEPTGRLVDEAWYAEANEALAYVAEQRLQEQNAAVAQLVGKVSFTEKELRAMSLKVLKTLAADVTKLTKDPDPVTQPVQPVFAFQVGATHESSDRFAKFKPAPTPFDRKEVN